MKRFHDLMASAAGRRFASEQEISDYLDAEKITDVTERIAFKHAMFAAGELHTDAPTRVDLATDTAVYRPEVAPLGGAIGTMLRKAGLSVDRQYSNDEITAALSRSGLALEDKLAVRVELGDRGLIKAAGEVVLTPRPTTITAKRSMQATAARPRGSKLTNPDGSYRTLTFTP